MYSNKDSTEPNRRNQGVNVTSNSLPNDNEPKDNVEEYIKQTINTMGPTSPQFSFGNNNDTDADNEESIYTNASVYRSYTKVKTKFKFFQLPPQIISFTRTLTTILKALSHIGCLMFLLK